MRKNLLVLTTAFCLLLLSQHVLAEKDQTMMTRISSDGLYHVTIESWLKPLRLGRMHAWEALIKDKDGNPITGAKIKIGGGMPIHNHGFPTEPIMTQESAPGTYVLEGFKFSMGGPWVMILDITSGENTDSVAFDIDM